MRDEGNKRQHGSPKPAKQTYKDNVAESERAKVPRRAVQLDSEDAVVEVFALQSEFVGRRPATARIRYRRRPVPIRLLRVGEGHGRAVRHVEAASPGQGWIRATPATAEPPSARPAIEHVLIDTGIVAGLQAGPEVVGGSAGEGWGNHVAREGLEILAAGGVEGHIVPGRRSCRWKQQSQKENTRSNDRQHDRTQPESRNASLLLVKMLTLMGSLWPLSF